MGIRLRESNFGKQFGVSTTSHLRSGIKKARPENYLVGLDKGYREICADRFRDTESLLPVPGYRHGRNGRPPSRVSYLVVC